MNFENYFALLSGLSLILVVIALLFLLIAVIWIYRDAQVRGKNGFVAAVAVVASAFYGPPAIVIVLCAWFLSRPEKTHQVTSGLQQHLPDKLPTGMSSKISVSDFMGAQQEAQGEDD